MPRPAISSKAIRRARLRVEKGEYVEIERKSLQAVQIESNHTIDIDSSCPGDEIDKRLPQSPLLYRARRWAASTPSP